MAVSIQPIDLSKWIQSEVTHTVERLLWSSHKHFRVIWKWYSDIKWTDRYLQRRLRFTSHCWRV